MHIGLKSNKSDENRGDKQSMALPKVKSADAYAIVSLIS
jgi:hypothetical protein